MTKFVGKEYTKRSSGATPNCGAIHGDCADMRGTIITPFVFAHMASFPNCMIPWHHHMAYYLQLTTIL